MRRVNGTRNPAFQPRKLQVLQTACPIASARCLGPDAPATLSAAGDSPLCSLTAGLPPQRNHKHATTDYTVARAIPNTS